jgi:SAM-dependent methyltransferase
MTLGSSGVFDDQKDTHPLFYAAASFLEDKAYFFKDVLRTLKRTGMDYDFAEELCRHCYEHVGENMDAYLENVRSLIEFSVEFLRLQKHLHDTGEYLYGSFQEVKENVYDDPGRELSGPWYTWALYFSQIFWVTHWEVMRFFRSEYCPTNQNVGSVLEVPTGTGIYLAVFLRGNPEWRGTGVDLSDSSIAFTRDVHTWYGVAEDRISLVRDDIYTWDSGCRYDRIMCGEFLEHLEDPQGVLRKIRMLLAPDGRVFITVAVYAAMIDHIYLYRSAEEVRVQIREAGLVPERELLQPVFTGRDPEERNTPVNYCAILKPAQ